MPVHWTNDGEVLTLVFDGEYGFGDIANAARSGLAAVTRPVRLIVDATRAGRLPDAGGVEQRLQLLTELRSRLDGRVAIVTTSGAMYGIARQIALRAELSGQYIVDVFTSMDAAREWVTRD